MSDIFPEAVGDGFEPHRRVAEFVGCHEAQVENAFRSLNIIEWEDAAHRKDVRRETGTINKAARQAWELAKTLRELDTEGAELLFYSATVTYIQIEALAAVLDGQATSLSEWMNSRNARASRNEAAYIVAEGVRRLFRRLRKPITYGQRHDDNGPSGDFCRTVEFAIGAFGVGATSRSSSGSANWRGPAKEANEKQQSINNRLIACQIRKADKAKHPNSISKK